MQKQLDDLIADQKDQRDLERVRGQVERIEKDPNVSALVKKGVRKTYDQLELEVLKRSIQRRGKRSGK